MELMTEVMNSLDLVDADGNKIIVQAPEDDDKKDNDNENAAPEKPSGHKSSGLTNVLIRLRDMGGAKIEIKSRENEGTNIKVYFPKQ